MSGIDATCDAAALSVSGYVPITSGAISLSHSKRKLRLRQGDANLGALKAQGVGYVLSLEDFDAITRQRLAEETQLLRSLTR